MWALCRFKCVITCVDFEGKLLHTARNPAARFTRAARYDAWKITADLAARWMISCRPYVNVRHYLLATADIQTCATLHDILPSLTLLPPPGDRFSRHFSTSLLFPSLCPPSLSLSLSCSLLLSIFLSFRTRLFSVRLAVYYVFHPFTSRSRPTFSFCLSFPLSPISQSYPRQRKMPGVSQSRERPAFSTWFVAIVRSTRSTNESVSRKYPSGTHGWTGPRRHYLSLRYHSGRNSQKSVQTMIFDLTSYS